MQTARLLTASATLRRVLVSDLYVCYSAERLAAEAIRDGATLRGTHGRNGQVLPRSTQQQSILTELLEWLPVVPP